MARSRYATLGLWPGGFRLVGSDSDGRRFARNGHDAKCLSAEIAAQFLRHLYPAFTVTLTLSRRCEHPKVAHPLALASLIALVAVSRWAWVVPHQTH